MRYFRLANSYKKYWPTSRLLQYGLLYCLLCTSLHSNAQEPPAVIADYHFDESSWSGTAGEVIDSSSSNFHGTAHNTSPIKGLICNAADLSADSARDYIALDNRILHGRNDVAVSFWVNSLSNRPHAIVSSANRRQNNEFTMWFPRLDRLASLIKGGAAAFIAVDGNQFDGNWHHFFWTRKDGENCLYLDGKLQQCKTGFRTGALQVDIGGLVIGQEQDSVGGQFDIAQDFEGQIDELLFFEGVPSVAQIQSIYNNQLAGKNWDGSERQCLTPAVEPEPVAYYGMEQLNWNGTAGEVIDSVNAINGTAINGLQTANSAPAIAGDIGTCRYGEFDGINDAVTLGNPAALNFSGQITVSAWIRPDKSNWIRNILAHGFRLNPNQAVYFRIVNGNYQIGTWQRVGIASSRMHNGDLGRGRWIHLTGVYDGAFWRLYRNGILIDSRRSAAATIQIDANWAIGARGNGRERYYDGGIDELYIFDHALTQANIRALMQKTHSCASPVDHYAISHAENYATCELATVKITAHNATHASVAPGNRTIEISTSTGLGDWQLKSGAGAFTAGAANQGKATYQFALTEEAVEFTLAHSSAADALDIDIKDGNNVTDKDGDATEDKPIKFSEAALRFYADNTAESISTKISGKPFDVASEGQRMTVRAVRTKTDTGACEAALQGPRLLDLGFECKNPNSCVQGQQLTAGTVQLAPNNAGATLRYAAIDVTFDSEGKAILPAMRYTDAGLIQLHTRVDVPASDSSAAQTIKGASNTFVVKPEGLCVEATESRSDCAATNISCSKFKAAGEQFDLTISARAWESSSDTQYCTGNTITPNYRESAIALKPKLLSPTDALAVNGELGETSVAITQAGKVVLNNQTYSEVGIIEIEAEASQYLGSEPIRKATSDPIGRFTPAWFKVTHLGLTNRADITNCQSDFTYLGEPLILEFTIGAYNQFDELTHNYHQGNGAAERYARLNTLHELQLVGIDTASATNLTSRLNDQGTQPWSWNVTAGEATVKTRFSVARKSAVDGAFERVSFAIAPRESEDGITTLAKQFDFDSNNDQSADKINLATTALRYGRLKINNAYGPQQLNLSLPVVAEYYNGTAFIQNSADNCTAIVTPTLAVDTTPSTVNLPIDKTTILNTLTPLISGIGAIELSATPTINDHGSIDVTLHTDPWLQFDWNKNATGDEMPIGKASFGTYRGHDRIIYRREILH